MKKQSIESGKFSKAIKFLKTVSDENRLKILLVLKSQSMNVTEIHRKLKLPQNLTSHHLSRLKNVGLLNEKRRGTFRNYSINGKKISEFSRTLKELLNI